MRVLIVEDEIERFQHLSKFYPGAIWASDGNRGRELVQAEPWDVVLLDFGLRTMGEMENGLFGEITGEDVAKALAKTRHPFPQVVIHSVSTYGPSLIAAVCRAAGIPFSLKPYSEFEKAS